MPSRSSCDCAHSCMDLSQALAQVHIHQSHCFHKNQAEAKRREEDWWQDRPRPAARLVKWAACAAWRDALGRPPPICPAVSQLWMVQRNGNRKYLIYIQIYICNLYKIYRNYYIYIYYTLSYNIYIFLSLSTHMGSRKSMETSSMVLCS